MFQTLLPAPSLDMPQVLSVLLVERGPKLNKAFKVGPHQVKWGNHCPGPVGHTAADTSQDASDLLRHLGRLWIMFSWVLTSRPRFFSAEQLSSHSSSRMRLLSPKCRTQYKQIYNFFSGNKQKLLHDIYT